MVRPEWSFVRSIYLTKKHCLIYRDEELGVQLQVETSSRYSYAGHPKSHYYIDGVWRPFRSEDAMLRALELRENGTSHPSLFRSPWRRIAYALNML